jgi:hypothetical protein
MKCAYCKEVGHHIRQCAKLEEKNNRCPKKSAKYSGLEEGGIRGLSRENPSGSRRYNQQITVVIPCVSKPVLQKPYSSLCESGILHNVFADLYSSDDDIEDGEIVEDNSDCSSTEEMSWSRSGIKGIYIPMPSTNLCVLRSSIPEYTIMTETTAETMAETFAYFETLRGRSWVDIEYDSDL